MLSNGTGNVSILLENLNGRFSSHIRTNNGSINWSYSDSSNPIGGI